MSRSKPLSDVAYRILKRADSRERGNICPVIDGNVRGASEMAIIHMLHHRGLITDAREPYITDVGRTYLKSRDETASSSGEGANVFP